MSGSKVVFVGNIPYEQTEEQLIEIFSEVGPVVSFRLVFDRDTGKPRGYGFCEFKDERTAASAARNLNGREVGNRILKVDYADSDPARSGGRDQEESSHMRSTGPGLGPPGSLPMMQAHMQQPPFMPPPGAAPRIDPRTAGNPNALQPPPPNRLQGPPPPPPMVGGPPPPRPNPTDAISAVLASMTPQNVFDLVSSMKVLGANEPERAKAVLNENPQLSYALFQALLLMNLVEPNSLQRMFPAMSGGPTPNPPAVQQPPQQHLPPPPPPPHIGMPPHMGMPPPHMGMPPQFTPPGFPGMVPPPAQGTAMGPSLEQQKALVAQVLALTDADIASLPEDQRANIIHLRAQLMGANV